MLRLFLVFALLGACLQAPAQVRVACTPEPLAVLQTLHVKTMGQWACYLRNDGTTGRTLAPEEVYMAVLAIRPIDPASGIIVLTDRQKHSVASILVKVLSVAGQVSGMVLSLVSKSNAALGTSLSVGAGFLPPLVALAQGEVPGTSVYTVNLLTAPITLPPGGTATRTIFCAKQKAPVPISVVVP